jgi:hypothetical protein
MTGPRFRPFLMASLLLVVPAIAVATLEGPGVKDRDPVRPPVVDGAFWSHWGDGRAEIGHYALTFPRYGEAREGTAVAIFVTEPFSHAAGVKADPGRHPESDVFQVIKLNLVKDFPTGMYDYNTMLSAFVSLEAVAHRSAGEPVKLSYSSQEWCGHVFHQVNFDDGAVRESVRSYFDGEGDVDSRRETPADAVAEDALLLWARGLASPVVEPGETVTVPVLTSLQEARLRHLPTELERVTLARSEEPRTITVPAGTFVAERLTASLEGGRTWTFDVERESPRRILRWEVSTGERGELVASERLPYWELGRPGDERVLERLGLVP